MSYSLRRDYKERELLSRKGESETVLNGKSKLGEEVSRKDGNKFVPFISFIFII